jgi:hypothetical protein
MAASINDVMPVTPLKPMKDEYGDMDSSGDTYVIKNFQLESGEVLPEAQVCVICVHVYILHINVSISVIHIHYIRKHPFVNKSSMYAFVNIFIYKHAYVSICVDIYVYIFIYVYSDI